MALKLPRVSWRQELIAHRGPWSITYRMGRDINGRWGIAKLTISHRADGPLQPLPSGGIDSSVLKTLRLNEERKAMAVILEADDWEAGRRVRSGRGRPLKRPEDFDRRIVSRYSELLRARAEAPRSRRSGVIKQLAKEFGLKRSTMASALHRAKERGHQEGDLPPDER